MRYLLALILSLLPLALGQTPFPYSSVSANAAQISSAVASYASSLKQQPAFTSFASLDGNGYCGASDVSAEFSSCQQQSSPPRLSIYLTAKPATPAWYTEIPSPLQSYVNSIAIADDQHFSIKKRERRCREG
jgi:hypothetical protein